MPRRLLNSNRAEVRPLFEGGVYSRPAFIKLAGNLRAYAVRQNDLPPCNRFFFEGGVYSRPAFIKLAGRYLRAYAVRQNDLPPCNRFFFCPLYTISALSFRHFFTRFLSTPNLLAAPLLLLVRVRVYVEPRPQCIY